MAKQAVLKRLPMGVFMRVPLRLDTILAGCPLYSTDAQHLEHGSLHALHHAPGSALVALMTARDTARVLIAAGEQAAIDDEAPYFGQSTLGTLCSIEPISDS